MVNAADGTDNVAVNVAVNVANNVAVNFDGTDNVANNVAVNVDGTDNVADSVAGTDNVAVNVASADIAVFIPDASAVASAVNGVVIVTISFAVADSVAGTDNVAVNVGVNVATAVPMADDIYVTLSMLPSLERGPI